MCFYLCMHCKCKLPHIPGHLFSGNALRPKQLQSKYCWKKAPLYSWVLQLGHNCWKPLLFRVGRFLCNNLTAAHFLESWGKLRNGLNPAFQSWNFCCNYWVHFQSGFILTWSMITPPSWLPQFLHQRSILVKYVFPTKKWLYIS